jgi:hypothetical protein
MIKQLIILTSILLWAGCQGTKVAAEGEVEAEGMVVSHLAADGCDWHIQVTVGQEFRQYVPTPATEPKLKAAVEEWRTQNSYSFTPISLRFRPTAGKQVVQCGWGKKGEFTEIEILSVSKK